jgi:hypothetical protein
MNFMPPTQHDVLQVSESPQSTLVLDTPGIGPPHVSLTLVVLLELIGFTLQCLQVLLKVYAEVCFLHHLALGCRGFPQVLQAHPPAVSVQPANVSMSSGVQMHSM